MSDPTNFTTGKTLVERTRVVKGEDPEEATEHSSSVGLELWEDRSGDRVWALSLMDDYRSRLGDGIHIRLSDEEAGWIQRNFTVIDDE